MSWQQDSSKRPKYRGPAFPFLAWALHDIEEAAAFPGTCDYLAERSGIGALRMNTRQSWTSVGLMAALVGFACWRGARTGGSSGLYRGVVAGLRTHVLTHLGATAVTRRYTAGVVTAVPIMLPGAVFASRELSHDGRPLRNRDRLLGAGMLLPAALACHVLVRLAIKR